MTWKVSKVRLTEGFACKDARRDVRNWIRGGGYMTDKHTLVPWTCEFGNRVPAACARPSAAPGRSGSTACASASATTEASAQRPGRGAHNDRRPAMRGVGSCVI